jgi:hypothetical protein
MIHFSATLKIKIINKKIPQKMHPNYAKMASSRFSISGTGQLGDGQLGAASHKFSQS